MSFKNFIESQYLYHATYKYLLPSIKEHGLNPSKRKKNWSDSNKVIYLATNKDVAVSYAETAENIPDEWLDEIVVLYIKKSGLDQNKLSLDKNVIDNDGSTLEYKGIIPFSTIIKVEYQ